MLGIKSERLAGMASMLMGVASFACMDAALKLLSTDYPLFQVAALRDWLRCRWCSLGRCMRAARGNW